MTPGYFTLDQLRNAPAGTAFKERRGSELVEVTFNGVPVETEFRATSRARGVATATPSDFEAWMRRVDEQTAELEEFIRIYCD
jgi:hypothetical protein